MSQTGPVVERVDWKRAPKIDLHRHLEGAIRPRTIWELYRKNGGPHAGIPLADLLPLVQVNGDEQSLFDFLAKFNAIMPALKTPADLSRITREAVEDAHLDGVIYLELRFSPHFIADFSGLDPDTITGVIGEAANEAAAAYDLPVELILIVPQYSGETSGRETLALARAHSVKGIDIAGDFRQMELEVYSAIFREAAASHLGITVHAGEVTPADTVRFAIEQLYASRIGHGIRSVDDPAVLELLLERGTVLEVCVTSNLQTRAADAVEVHPIKELVAAGVRVVVSTDDPGISDLRLSDDYALLNRSLGFSWDQMRALQIDAMQAAFTSRERQQGVIEKLKNWNQ